MFIGPKAQTFNPDQIVGYGKADGLPRMEIDDSKATLKLPIEQITKPGKRRLRLGEIIDHPELFKAYPGLKRTPVHITSKDGGEVDFGFNRDGGLICMNLVPGMTAQKFLGHLSHETQHNVQQIEGFIGGAGTRSLIMEAYAKTTARLRKRADKTKNPELSKKGTELAVASELVDSGVSHVAKGRIEAAADQLIRRSHRLSRRIPGEVEASAVTDRIGLNALERASKPAPHIADTPPAIPQVREYSSLEKGTLRTYARRTKMVLLGDAVTNAFNTLVGRLAHGPAYRPKPTPSNTVP